MKLSQAYIKTLQRQQEDVKPRLYQCSNCYRPNLTPAQVGILSKGDVLCRTCVRDSK